mgnify:CR=1 FL=1
MIPRLPAAEAEVAASVEAKLLLVRRLRSDAAVRDVAGGGEHNGSAALSHAAQSVSEAASLAKDGREWWSAAPPTCATFR